jgi:hypothetical protein
MTKRTLVALVLLALATGSSAFAESVTVGSLTLTDLWTNATPPGEQTANGYLTITNGGSEPDRLIAVSTPMAGTSEIHQMEMTGDVMTMTSIDSIEIPAGSSVTLTHHTLHLIFIGLKVPLTEGRELPVTLVFEKAGTVDTVLEVLAIDAAGPDGSASVEHSGH